MGKSAQNKELLDALSTAFNIKKKHINIQQSEDGSCQLKLKKISAETIGNIIQNNHLVLSFVEPKTTPISSVKAIDPNVSSNTIIIGPMNDADVNESTIIEDESITLPKTFNEIPLPCNCPNCQLNTAYALYLVGRNNLRVFSKKHALPTRKKIKSSSSLKKVYGNLLTQKKRLTKTLTAHKRNILDLIVKVDPNIAVPSTALLDAFSINPNNKVLTYKTPKNQIEHFAIPSTCINQTGSVVLSKTSTRVDESANSTPKEIPTTKNITTNAQNCDCIPCKLNSKYNVLKDTQAEYKRNINGPFFNNNQRPKKNAVRACRNKRRVQRKFLMNKIDTIGKEIATLIPKLGLIVTLPDLKNPSLQATVKHNTVKYTGINNKRIEFVIPSNCLKNIKRQDLNPSSTEPPIIAPHSAGILDTHESLFQTDDLRVESQPTTDLFESPQAQQEALDCQCLHCVVGPLYSKLKNETHQHLSLSAKIKSLKQSSSKSKKLTAKDHAQNLANIQKQKNTVSVKIKKTNQSIVQKINQFTHLIQPHPTRSSIAILKQKNTISYLSDDEVRVCLTLTRDCKPI